MLIIEGFIKWIPLLNLNLKIKNVSSTFEAFLLLNGSYQSEDYISRSFFKHFGNLFFRNMLSVVGFLRAHSIEPKNTWLLLIYKTIFKPSYFESFNFTVLINLYPLLGHIQGKRNW
jgi:hypothetical protein